MAVAKSIDKFEVVEAYPGTWAVDATGIKVPATDAAEAVRRVQWVLMYDERTEEAP